MARGRIRLQNGFAFVEAGAATESSMTSVFPPRSGLPCASPATKAQVFFSVRSLNPVATSVPGGCGHDACEHALFIGTNSLRPHRAADRLRAGFCTRLPIRQRAPSTSDTSPSWQP